MNTLSRGKGLLTRTQITYWLTVLDTTLYRRLDRCKPQPTSQFTSVLSSWRKLTISKCYVNSLCNDTLHQYFYTFRDTMVSAAAPGGTVVLNVYGLHFFGEAWNDPISRLQKYMVSVMKFLDGILLKHKSVYWITEHFQDISLAFNLNTFHEGWGWH